MSKRQLNVRRVPKKGGSHSPAHAHLDIPSSSSASDDVWVVHGTNVEHSPPTSNNTKRSSAGAVPSASPATNTKRSIAPNRATAPKYLPSLEGKDAKDETRRDSIPNDKDDRRERQQSRDGTRADRDRADRESSSTGIKSVSLEKLDKSVNALMINTPRATTPPEQQQQQQQYSSNPNPRPTLSPVPRTGRTNSIGSSQMLGLTQVDSESTDEEENMFRAMVTKLSKEQMLDYCCKQQRIIRQYREREELRPQTADQSRFGNANSNAHPNMYSNELLARSTSGVGVIDSIKLLQLTELLSTNTQSDVLLQRLIEASTTLINVQYINLFIIDEAGGELICRASKGNVAPEKDGKESVNERSFTGTRIPLNFLGIVGYVAKAGRPVVVPNVKKDWRYSAETDTRKGITVNSLLTVPVHSVEGKTIALLEALNSKSDNGFSADDEGVLKAMACSVSTLLRTAGLERELNNQIKQTEALVQIAELTSAELGVDKVIEKIVKASKVVVNASRLSLYIVDDASNELVEACRETSSGSSNNSSNSNASGMPASPSPQANGRESREWKDTKDLQSISLNVNDRSMTGKIRIPIGEGVAGHVALTGRPANIPDASKDWRFDMSHEEKKRSEGNEGPTRSVLAIPVKDYRGKTVAVLEAVNKPKLDVVASTTANGGCSAAGSGVFTTEDARLLTSLAATAASVLRQAQLFDEAIKRRNQTEALRQITELMAAEIGTEMVVPRIIEAAYKLVHADRISFFTVVDRRLEEWKEKKNDSDHPHPHPTHDASQSTKELICQVSKDQNFIGKRIKWGAGIVGHVALTLKSLNIKDAYQDARFNTNFDKKTGFITKSILTVPVIDNEGKGVAVIQAVNRQGGDGTFGQEDVAILETLAVSAGIILRKSTLIQGLVLSEKKSRALMNLLKVVSMKDSNMEKVINGIVQVAYDVLNADRVTIFFVDNAEMFSMVSHDMQGIRFPVGQGIAGSVAQNGILVNIKDAYEDTRFDRGFDQKTGYRTKSILCMPVKDFDGRCIAVVQALNKRASSNLHMGTMGALNTSLVDTTRLAMNRSNSDAVLPTKDTVNQRSPSKRDSVSKTKPSPSTTVSTSFTQTSPRDDKPTDDGDAAWTSFTSEDEELLEAFCVQIRTTIRKCLTDAILKEATLDKQVQSLVELYTDRSESKTRFTSNLSIDRSPTEFKWPKISPSLSSTTDLKNRSEFDVWSHSDDDLLGFTVDIFNEMGLVDTYQIPMPKLKNFLLAVRAKYNNNPFHNWKHGFSVFHFSYLMMLHTKAVDHLTTPDVLALLVGSLCHDIDHPGNTNSFEINSLSSKALIHNDLSVLENHHAYQTFSILRDGKCDIFSNIKPQTQKALRKVIIQAILSTDMTAHFEYSDKLTSIEKLDAFDRNNEKDRQFLINTLIHSSDLSAQVLPIKVAREWEDRITQEFAAQADLEEKKKMPVAPFMQGLSIPKTRYKLQVNFIDFVLTPWWKNVVRIMPTLHDCFTELMNNKKYYEQLSTQAPAEDIKLTPAAAPSAPVPALSITLTPVHDEKDAAKKVEGIAAPTMSVDELESARMRKKQRDEDKKK